MVKREFEGWELDFVILAYPLFSNKEICKPLKCNDRKVYEIAYKYNLKKFKPQVRADLPKYYDFGNCIAIKTERSSKMILIDKEDFEKVNGYHWRICKNYGYVISQEQIGNERKFFSLHRHILNIKDEDVLIDHKDNNRLNNRKQNLRVCNYQQNALNRKKTDKLTSSIYKGVCFARKKWTATVGFKGKRYFLGYFLSEEEAAKAYDQKAKELHGEFANLNFPGG